MAKFFSFTATRDWLYRYSFSIAGLKSAATDLGDGTVMHCWVPKTRRLDKPNLVLIHGLGANAMWQWNDFINPLIPHFNLFVPDLLFFGDSYTSRPDRSEAFQAECVMKLMEGHGVEKMDLVGISYGGFVAYSMVAQFGERVERLVMCCAGVCLEEKDMNDGMFEVKSVDEAVSILLPQTADKMRDLLRLTFHKPAAKVPSFFLNDFIQVMCTEYFQERKELIEALHKGRKLCDLPRIAQKRTLLIWGEYDKVFPLELAYRLKRHVGEHAELVIIKNAGHAINAETPKELCQHLESFLVDCSNGDKVSGQSLGQ